MLESCENKSIQARYWGCAEGAPGIYGACYGYCFGQNMSALIQERYQSCMNDYKDKSPTQSSREQFCTNYSRAIPL